LDDGVFVGPGAILTNDRVPRAITVEGEPKSANDWEPVGVHVEHGASIGAGAICVAPLRIGRWAMIASGAVLISDARAFGCYAGVPARQTGWIGPAGFRLVDCGSSTYRCPATGSTFAVLPNGELRQEE
jgi:acetyltransferase-like isoleucine patch superfamily enzyme